MKETGRKIFLDPEGAAIGHLRKNDRAMNALLDMMDVGSIGYEIEPMAAVPDDRRHHSVGDDPPEVGEIIESPAKLPFVNCSNLQWRIRNRC